MEKYLDLKKVFYNNTVSDYLYVVGGILVAWIVLQIVKKLLLIRIKRLTGRSKTNFDDVIISAFEKFVIPYAYFVINYTIINQLRLSAKANHYLEIAMTIVTIFFVVRMINHAMHFSVQLYMRRHNEPDSRLFQLNGILNVIKTIVWALGFLFFLDNLGYNVSTIIAGLGIGGIAVALAAQNILGDLFSYFVIFFDKPFEIGDFVVAGSESGTVEQIGIKTSRIRTLGGEELVMPNADLVKTPIHNFKRQEKRRVVFNVKVAYATPSNLLKDIPNDIKQVISTKENLLFDRAHLQALADYYINYEVVYNIPVADFNLYMDRHQQVCLDLIDVFRNKGIEFAIPTQQVFVEKKEEVK